DVEKKMLEMLKGAMEALNIGDPWLISTDVGPVIDDEAQASIRDYCTKKGLEGRLIAKLEAPKDGRFVAPHVLRVKGIEDMEREVFGPVLHVA
ncbi:aldehyde dehydrogenase family protein, partial [Mesorhizobium sp. M1C.F.Ca.ET.195.01.1.1]